MWTDFFHKVADFFGMEAYFIKVYTHPEVVEAVTEYVVDFYLEANKRCFETLGDKLDIFFIGNDFGTQRDLIISPDMFNRFVLPGYKKMIDLAKSYNKKVMIHSCGAIGKVIPTLIEAGVDAIHPLQALAHGMDADSLSKYKDQVVFVGGIDAQYLLPNGSPDDIRQEIDRISQILGPRYIASPSHETLMPDVPMENILAMRDYVISLS